MKGILQTAERAYEEKQNKRRIELEAANATEQRQAMTTASFPQEHQRTNGARGLESLENRTTSSAPLFAGGRTNDPHSQSSATGLGSSTRSRDRHMAEQTAVSPTRKPSLFPAKVPPSPTKNASSNVPSSLRSRFTPPPPPPSSSPAPSPARTNVAMPSPAAALPALKQQNSKPYSPVSKPAPYSGSMMSPKTAAKVQPALVGSSEYLSRLGKGKSPETVKDPWNDTVKVSERDWNKRQSSPVQTSVTATANIVKVASPSAGSSTGNSRSPSMSPPPPPVPTYNPSQPDIFVLSNQKEYLVKQSKSRRSGAEEERRGTTRGSFDVAPLNRHAKKVVLKVAPIEVACNGLPRSGKNLSRGRNIQ